jgi:hypothetical protein
MADAKELTIQQIGREPLTLSIPLTSSGLQLKKQIYRLTRIDPHLQILTIGPEEIADRDILRNLEIVEGDVIMLQERYDDSQNSIRIMVTDNATMTRPFTVSRSTKVEELITEVMSVIPNGNFSLALHGVVMEAGKTMAEYGLTENEEVRLMANLEGGSS